MIGDEVTETEQVTALPNGSETLEESSLPVRAELDDGAWAPIDETLTRSADGRLEPKVAAIPVTFSPGGAGPLATITSDSDRSVAISVAALGALPAPTVQWSSATYHDVLPGIDLRLTATADGMRDVFVVKTPAAAADSRLDSLRLAIGGATVSPVGGGTVAITTPDGSTVAAATPTWWDSSDGGSASGPGGPDIPLPLATSSDSSAVVVDGPPASATDTADYPIFVDPAITGGVQGRTFVDNAYPNAAYWNGAGASDSFQHVGYINAGNSDDGRDHVTRSFWQMDLNGLAGKYVDNAVFNTTERWASSCSPRNVTLQLTGGVASGTTWNNQPAAQLALDNKNVAWGYNSSCPAQAVGFSATAGVRQVVGAGYTNGTFGLYTAENDWLAWKKFDANATLTVSFHSYPGSTVTWASNCHRAAGMSPGDILRINDRRWSYNGAYMLKLQDDGNLVVYRAASAFSESSLTATWSTLTRVSQAAAVGTYVIFQTDGNVVMYRPGAGAIFSTGTYRNAPVGNLIMQDDGNFVVYDTFGRAAWWSGNQGTSPVPVTCYTNTVAASSTEPVTAIGSSADPNQYTQFEEGEHGSATAQAWSSSNVPVAWNAPVSSDSSYIYHARTCVNADDGTPLCGPWSYWVRLIIDRTAPAAPTATASGPVSVTSGTRTGVVGVDVETISTSSSTNDADAAFGGYQYSVIGIAPDPNAVQAPANPGCGQMLGGYSVDCKTGATGTVTRTVTPIDENSEFLARAFDMAGNVSTPTVVKMYANPDKTNAHLGHSWLTNPTDTHGNTATCPPSAQVPDSSATSPLPLTLTGAVCWQQANPQTPPVAAAQATFADLTINSAAGQGTTSASTGAPVDTSKSFTVGGWLYTPLTVAAGHAETAISVDGTNESTVSLQDSQGKWAMCLPWSDSAAWAGDCVVGPQVTPGTWAFVVGVYDAVNHQARIYVSPDGNFVQASAAVTHGSNPVATGALKVGIAKGSNAAIQPWTGQIAVPFIFPGVISSSMFATLGANLLPTSKV